MCGSGSLKNSKSVCVVDNKLSSVSRDLINTVVSSEWGGGAGGGGAGRFTHCAAAVVSKS